MVSNIWNHPKTSVAGLLIGILTVAGVFAAQGVTLGHAGTGTVVSLVSAIATALLGLLARDPGASADNSQASSATTPGQQTKLGAWMLVSLILLASLPIGCTTQQKISVAQAIVNYGPLFISVADTVNATIEGLDPATILVLGPTTAALNAFGPQFVQAAQAYLNNPNQTTLQLLQAIVTQIQQNANNALLSAAKVTNPSSQAAATKAINSLAVMAQAILGLVQSISTKAQIAAMARPIILVGSPVPQHITLAQVRQYMDMQSMQAMSERTTRMIGMRPISPNEFFGAEAAMGF
jgi:hypothetical protein